MSPIAPERFAVLQLCAANPANDDAGDLYREMCGYTGRALTGWMSWLKASRQALKDKDALWETKKRRNQGEQVIDFIGTLENLHPKAILEAASPDLLEEILRLHARIAELEPQVPLTPPAPKDVLATPLDELDAWYNDGNGWRCPNCGEQERDNFRSDEEEAKALEARWMRERGKEWRPRDIPTLRCYFMSVCQCSRCKQHFVIYNY